MSHVLLCLYWPFILVKVNLAGWTILIDFILFFRHDKAKLCYLFHFVAEWFNVVYLNANCQVWNGTVTIERIKGWGEEWLGYHTIDLWNLFVAKYSLTRCLCLVMRHLVDSLSCSKCSFRVVLLSTQGLSCIWFYHLLN